MYSYQQAVCAQYYIIETFVLSAQYNNAIFSKYYGNILHIS